LESVGEVVDEEPQAVSKSEQMKINTNASNPYLLNCLLFILPVPFISLLAFTESICINLTSRNGVDYD
jgi:hypothetical protein